MRQLQFRRLRKPLKESKLDLKGSQWLPFLFSIFGHNRFMLLQGKKGLVLNVTNKNSIGWAIADLANQHGAIVGVGAQNERLQEGVDKLLDGRTGFETVQIDFGFDDQYETMRKDVEKKLGKLDFLVHSVGYAPKEALVNRFIDTTLEDFQVAMNASVYSMVRTCKELEPLMNEDSSIITLSYIGSTRVMNNYKVMGLCKAALEASVRYLAYELGDRGIQYRVPWSDQYDFWTRRFWPR
jgi:enoyl-[acyl-carrier protein] reductase I